MNAKPDPASKVLIVEDEAILAMGLSLEIERMARVGCLIAPHAVKALAMLELNGIRAALIDINLPGPMNGFELADIIRGRFSIPIMFMSGFDNKEMLKQMTEYGFAGHLFFPKPFTGSTVSEIVRIVEAS